MNVVIFSSLGSGGAFTMSPSNRAVLSGTSRVNMSCASSLGYAFINWNYIPVGGSSEVIIAAGSTVINEQKPYYAVEQPGDQQNNLIILSATVPRAGTYICIEGGSQRASAQLIIIGKLSFYAIQANIHVF